MQRPKDNCGYDLIHSMYGISLRKKDADKRHGKSNTEEVMAEAEMGANL